MNRQIVFAAGGGLAVGLLAGYLVFSGRSETQGPIVAAPVAGSPLMPAPALGGGMPPGAVPGADIQARITRLEASVLADPKNHGAWVSLGNDYFDSHQFQKSVDAYGKALALKPDDPNVLTDQGVMYRELKQFDKALANFRKANQIQPTHVQSLFNMGVVYANDLHQHDEAAKAWNQVIAVAPASPQAAQARQMLGQMKP